MRISFFQYTPKFMAIEENLHEITSLLQAHQADILRSDVVIFPEYFLSGSINMQYLKEYEEVFHTMQLVDTLKHLTTQYSEQVFVFWSIIMSHDNEKYYNASLVIQNGAIVTEYHKKALIYNENYICDSDAFWAIFEVNGVRYGLSICWDMILPEVYRMYVWKIDIMIVPAFWWIGGNALQVKYPFSLEKKYYCELWVARAYENAFSLLFVNSVGQYHSPFYSDRMMWGSFYVQPPLWVMYKTNNKKWDFLHTLEIDLHTLSEYREFYATDTDYFYYKEKGFI